MRLLGSSFPEQAGRGGVYVPVRGLGEEAVLCERARRPAEHLRVHLQHPGQLFRRHGLVAELVRDADAYRGSKRGGPRGTDRELTHTDDRLVIGDIFFLNFH